MRSSRETGEGGRTVRKSVSGRVFEQRVEAFTDGEGCRRSCRALGIMQNARCPGMQDRMPGHRYRGNRVCVCRGWRDYAMLSLPGGSYSRSVKEVIQPQVPLRLPCYDFAPVTALAFGRLIPCGFRHGLRALTASMA